jgi:GAF domain-containing protein
MAVQDGLDISDQVARVNDLLTSRIPDVVAFSLGIAREGITLTYVASQEDAARLDALQYVDDGPCEQAIRTGEVVATEHDDLLDEGRWQLFAQAGAAAGIRSTLSLPVLGQDRVVGSVNLYGRTSDTFVGRHQEVAALVGGWAAGAVTNADLGFTTRLEARRSPRRLDDLETVQNAVDRLAAERGVSPELAENKLYEAAARAGIPVVALAHMVNGEWDAEPDGPRWGGSA